MVQQKRVRIHRKTGAVEVLEIIDLPSEDEEPILEAMARWSAAQYKNKKEA